MWLPGRLAPDHKTIADFRKDNGLALRKVCVRFVELCREMGLLTAASVSIDGSKFKAVNNRDKNFTWAKVERRRAQLEESIARYLSQLDTADRQEPTEALVAKVRYWTTACQDCSLKSQCTTGPERRIPRWEHEHLLEAVQQAMRQRRETVEHPFGTMKARMGATHFLTKTLPKVAAEMALSVLAYNLTRVINIVGIKPLIAAIAA